MYFTDVKIRLWMWKLNLGDDTDTVAAICGGIARVLFGEIPERWVKGLRKKGLIEEVIGTFSIKEKERRLLC